MRFRVFEDYRASFPPTDLSVKKESVKSEYTLKAVIRALLEMEGSGVKWIRLKEFFPDCHSSGTDETVAGGLC